MIKDPIKHAGDSEEIETLVIKRKSLVWRAKGIRCCCRSQGTGLLRKRWKRADERMAKNTLIPIPLHLLMVTPNQKPVDTSAWKM